MSGTVFRGGHVLTMDDAIGDLPRGDVHVRDGRIVAIGEELDPPGAEVIDVAGRIVLPGLIDGHRHTWQALLRGVGADWSFPEYMAEARTLYSGCFDAEDAYVANYLGGLESLNAGITSIVDHSHLQSSPEVSDALARGLRDSGIGGVFCYALQNVPRYPEGSKPAARAVRDLILGDPEPWHDAHATRLRDTLFDEGPLRFGIALPEFAPYVPGDRSARLIARARALKPALVTGHWNATCRDGQYVSSVADLADADAFATRTLLTHFNLGSDDDLRTLVREQVGLCTCPDIEAGMGLGRLLAPHFVELGGNACLGLDVTSVTGPDLFAQARMQLQVERKAEAGNGGASPANIGYRSRAALELITSTAARAIGQGREVGSLTPGKRADIIVVAPDPVATLLFYTSVQQIEIVMVAGNVLKREGRLRGIDPAALQLKTRAAAERIQVRYECLPKAELKTVWDGVF